MAGDFRLSIEGLPADLGATIKAVGGASLTHPTVQRMKRLYRFSAMQRARDTALIRPALM
jgi:hypothetical protein